jgi:hypothetical protein
MLHLFKPFVHLLLILDVLLHQLKSQLLLGFDRISDLVLIFIDQLLLVVHVDLEFGDGVTTSKPHGVLFPLQLLVDAEEDDLVGPLTLEDSHDLETLLIVLCLGLVLVHRELGKVLLIGLEHLGHEEGA